MSLDGYIASGNDDISFLDSVSVAGEDYGYGEFYKDIDTVVMGRRTFDIINKLTDEFPHKDKTTYIVTRNSELDANNINYYSGDIAELISNIKNNNSKDIFIDGGAELVNSLLQGKLIDEIIISVIPVLLGDGIRLFNTNYGLMDLKLISTKKFDSGLVQIRYLIVKF